MLRHFDQSTSSAPDPGSLVYRALLPRISYQQLPKHQYKITANKLHLSVNNATVHQVISVDLFKKKIEENKKAGERSRQANKMVFLQKGAVTIHKTTTQMVFRHCLCIQLLEQP